MSSNLQTHSMALPDVISTSLNVIFCGINPGMQSAILGLHFPNRSNRFWRVLHLAGFTARQLGPGADYIAARPMFERKIAKYRQIPGVSGKARDFDVSGPTRSLS